MTEIFYHVMDETPLISDTATDADSPNSEALMDALRRSVELLIFNVNGNFQTGTLTSDPPNDTTGYAYDTAAGFEDDEHNGRRLIFRDGNAKGQDFLIDDTQASSNRVVCTGDNLYSAGARSGDSYVITGNFRDGANSGHTHDTVNSKQSDPVNGRIHLPYGFGTFNSSADTCSSAGTVDTWEDFYDTAIAGTLASEATTLLLPTAIYIPNEAGTLRTHIGFSDFDYSQEVRVRIRLTELDGSGGTGSSSYSNTSIEPDANYKEDDLDIDCSSLSPGWYEISLQTYRVSGATSTILYGLQTIWIN